MKDHRNTAKADRIDALMPLLGTLFAGLAFGIIGITTALYLWFW